MQQTNYAGVMGAKGMRYRFPDGKRAGYDPNGMVVRIYEGDRQGRVLARRDADGAGRLLAKLAERRQLSADLVERRAERPQQPFAGLGGGDASRGSAQQADAEPFLEPADGEAQRRLGGAEPGRGPRETALFGDRDEGVEIGKLLAPHS